MRLVSFLHRGAHGYGRIDGADIVRLDGEGAPGDLKGWLASGDGGRTDADVRIPYDEVQLLPPIPRPTKIFCVATNFHEPARDGLADPDYPLLFTRTGEAQVGHGQPLLRPSVSERFDFEGELAVVIGRPGRRIARDGAMAHVAGYACFNDGSVRDWQKHSSQFTPGKNFVGSGAFGPWLVTADDVPDPAALTLETRVNGIVKQAIALREMIFGIPWLIAYCSTFASLETGDVIVTGTPTGFGSSREPPEFLKEGDVVEVDIPGVGLLRNAVVDDRGDDISQ